MQVAKGVRIWLSMRFCSLTSRRASNDVYQLYLGSISNFLHHVEIASIYEKKLRVSINTNGCLGLAEPPLSIYSPYVGPINLLGVELLPSALRLSIRNLSRKCIALCVLQQLGDIWKRLCTCRHLPINKNMTSIEAFKSSSL